MPVKTIMPRRPERGSAAAIMKRKRALTLIGTAVVKSGDVTKYMDALPLKERKFVENNLAPWTTAKDEADFFLLSPLRGAGVELDKVQLKTRKLSL